ncbi:hypothetical protein [Candidatus Methanomethylophilus sp. 1R26]|uniref:hypothetical protein n=1 Tax=Candidatus Methanomethylophilus sp. 1R26 TaxID=1769296 RepID=UPI0019102309|nr:hypothetical protein [Candidatus Methanomethylophilus sp. 1R26]
MDRESPIFGKLYQFSQNVGMMAMPVHQYLLASDPPIMFATGTASQAEWILPRIDRILGGKPLKYLFISHMESDECGGYMLFHKKYPKISVICSSFTAKEMQGFGYKGRIIVGDSANGINDASSPSGSTSTRPRSISRTVSSASTAAAASSTAPTCSSAACPTGRSKRTPGIRS